MNAAARKELEKRIQQNIEYRDFLKAQLPNAGINYEDIQSKLRQTRAIITRLEFQLGCMFPWHRR